MTPFVFNTTAQIVCEPGSSANIAQICNGRLGQTVLFVTDKGIRDIGLEQKALTNLQESGVEVTVFDQVQADPDLATLMQAVDIARANACTGVVALGGGSPMDVAKLVALLVGSGENIEDAWGVANAKGPRLPLVLIPTTAGTGSEVTPVSIITVDGEEKRGVSSPVILPDIAILDAELTLGLPAGTTAATGIDAMVHAIEAYASTNANNNPVSQMLAIEALKLLGANIKTAVFSPTDIKARSGMLLGSCLAGMAFANSPVAAVHALAYPIGGTFHIPHGLSNAIILAKVLQFNSEDLSNQSHEQYAALAPHVFPDLRDVPDAQARCCKFIDRISELSVELGLPSRLRDIGIPEDALPKMASDAMKQTRLLVNNPRELSEADALSIYKSAW